MKRTTKFLLGLGSLLALAGILLSVVGWTMGGETDLSVDWFGHPINIGIHGIYTESRITRETPDWITEQVGIGTSDSN